MSPLLVATALIVVAGAIVAVSARDGRTAVLGLAVALVLAPLLTSPLPEGLGLAARLVGAILAAFLVWSSLGEGPSTTRGSLLGLPSDATFALAAAVAGYGVHSAVGGLAGPAAATVTGFALLALALAPVTLTGDPLRLGIGCVLLVLGALSLQAGVAGTPPPLENLVASILVIGIAAASAAAVSAGPVPLADAHPLEAPAERATAPRRPRLRGATRLGLPGGGRAPAEEPVQLTALVDEAPAREAPAADAQAAELTPSGSVADRATPSAATSNADHEFAPSPAPEATPVGEAAAGPTEKIQAVPSPAGAVVETAAPRWSLRRWRGRGRAPLGDQAHAIPALTADVAVQRASTDEAAETDVAADVTRAISPSELLARSKADDEAAVQPEELLDPFPAAGPDAPAPIRRGGASPPSDTSIAPPQSGVAASPALAPRSGSAGRPANPPVRLGRDGKPPSRPMRDAPERSRRATRTESANDASPAVPGRAAVEPAHSVELPRPEPAPEVEPARLGASDDGPPGSPAPPAPVPDAKDSAAAPARRARRIAAARPPRAVAASPTTGDTANLDATAGAGDVAPSGEPTGEPDGRPGDVNDSRETPR